ncbi:SDR family NAD(P)-dependent oxidoreductase [Novosphingobium sp. BL-52-GroH]|uniref:SDR family NAD(P)-dependent oxidoreductase n=1 Tax=Novosphingobium sp. BL-52-GroH TaxID=3349877 RepID=UPI00384C5C51
MRFKDKVAIVTGGASGLGRATAMRLASEGASVGIADINDAGAKLVAEEIADAGGVARPLRLDITVEEDFRSAVGAMVESYGRLDIMHNNAAFTSPEAIAQDTDILEISNDIWDQIFAGTVRGTMHGCRHAILAMRRHGGGAIVNTASMYGVEAFYKMPAYCVSKAAVIQLTKQVATAFGRQGIRCNAVAPSMISTPLLDASIPAAFIEMNAEATLTGYLGTPEDVAQAVAWLASDEARYITGQVIRVDGGSTAHLATYADARRFYDAPVAA